MQGLFHDKHVCLSSFFFDSGLLPGKFPEIVYPCSPYLSALVDLDLLKCRKVQWEYSFHSNSSAHLPNGKGLRSTRSFLLDHNATKKLGPCFSSLCDFVIDRDCISCREFREILFCNKFLLYKVD